MDRMAAKKKKSRSAPMPVGADGVRKASLFMNGRSQAVRLPKEFRFEGTHVFARKEGNRVILSPTDDRMERFLAAFGSSPDFPDIPKDEPEPVRKEIAEYFGVPDR
jgi:antitoxin VapB